MLQHRYFKILCLICGLVLTLDGLILLAAHKTHLGTILPLCIGLTLCSYALWQKQIFQRLAQHPRLKRLCRIASIAFVLWLVSLLIFFIYLAQPNTTQPTATTPPQAIIVLGSGVIQGQPSPTLAARLDQAAMIAQQYPQALIIVSGGLDYAETETEATVMSTYLQQHHAITASRIAEENQSTSTELNLKNSQVILAQHDITLDAPIAIVTSDFHSLRAAAIAHKQGYHHIYSIPATTPLSTRYNAWLREYFAYISGWLLNEY